MEKVVDGGYLIDVKTRSCQIDVELSYVGIVLNRAKEVMRRVQEPFLNSKKHAIRDIIAAQRQYVVSGTRALLEECVI